MDDLMVFKAIFEAVFELANYEMNIFGKTFTPLDFWVFIAAMYLIADGLLDYIGMNGSEEDYDNRR